MTRKIVAVLLSALMVFSAFAISSDAKQANRNDKNFSSGFSDKNALFDSNRKTFTKAKSDAEATLIRESGIAHLYVEFDRIPDVWTIEDTNGEKIECGKNGFLHEYVDIKLLFGYCPEKLVLSFPKGISVCDIYAFSDGTLPEFVQIWSRPLEKADIMLVSTHSDDEHLFFAGILPYYILERELDVQVVYAIQHFEIGGQMDHIRPHEQLDGLYSVGVRNYPVMSDIPDVYAKGNDRNSGFESAKREFSKFGITLDDFKEFLAEVTRQFKPEVIVTHDLDGEYGHGAHVFVAKAMTEIIEIVSDKTKFPESASKYGVWKPQKLYLHLYEENKITMDWDRCYDSLGAKTPFERSQSAFGCHKSQHWTWFYGWIYGKNGNKITKASQIKKHSPCEFGLFYSSVGEDKSKNDFFENVKVQQHPIKNS